MKLPSGSDVALATMYALLVVFTAAGVYWTMRLIDALAVQ